MQKDRPAPSGRHSLVPSPAGRIHLVEAGSGPLVLLVHGFPESWYSWRYQLPSLAAAGYRAVAVVQALGESTAVIVGHDWGAGVAASSALLRPEVFTAAALLSVPYTPPGGPRPSDVFAGMGSAEAEFYVSYFQQPGRAEAEIEPDVRGWLAGFYAALSADTMPGTDDPSVHFVQQGGRLRDRFPADRLPGWLTPEDLDVYAGEFERTGLTGALNRYRNLDRDWQDLADLAGRPLTQPTLFIGGALDASTTWLSDAIAAFPTTMPRLAGSHVLEATGHWTQQERPEEVNALLTTWLAGLAS